jgi:hypothetical protein
MKRKLYLFVLSAVIVLIGIAIKDLKADFLCGCYDDRSVNVSGAVWIINYIFIGGPELSSFLLAEVISYYLEAIARQESICR